MTEKKSAEEIIRSHGLGVTTLLSVSGEYSTIDAMNEYAAQELSEYKAVIKELIPLAKAGAAYYRQNPGFDWVAEREKSVAIIDRARKLIDKL